MLCLIHILFLLPEFCVIIRSLSRYDLPLYVNCVCVCVFFLIHMSIIWICVTIRVCPSILCGRKFNIGHYTQTLQPNLFIPAMLIGTIDFYQFILFSLTLALPGGHMVSAKQNLLASCSPTLFIWTFWFYFWVQLIVTTAPIISQSFQSIWVEFDCFWDLQVWWTWY